MEAPRYIKDAHIIGSPISYKWDTEIAADLMERENKKLETAVEKLTFKAGFALGIAMTEWIIFRFEGHADLADARQRIEAAWVGVIDPVYVKTLEKDLPDDEEIDDKEIVLAPLTATLYTLGEMFNDYVSVDISGSERIVTQALLGRHLVPAKKPFEDWLSESLRRASKTFPLDLDRFDREGDAYSVAEEKPVPREFFDPTFAYNETTAKAALKAFLKSVDPKKNPYLRSPAELKAQGFKGTAYVLE